jgi:hypothetical protein
MLHPEEKKLVRNAIASLEAHDETEGNSEDVDNAVAILRKLIACPDCGGDCDTILAGMQKSLAEVKRG